MFWPAFKGPFLFDDLLLPMLKMFAPEVPEWQRWLGASRPVLMATYWFDYLIGGKEPFGFHLTSLLLHVANSLLVFVVVRLLLARSGISEHRAALSSAAAAALFLFHPLQTEAVCYVWSRSDVFGGTLFLAALWLYLRHSEGGIGWGAASVATILFWLGLGAKETMATLPLAVILLDFQKDSGVVAGIRRNWRWWAGIPFALAASFLWFRLYFTLTKSVGPQTGISPIGYFYSSWRAWLTYFRLMLFPVSLNADYESVLSRSPFENGAIYSLVALIVVGVLLYLARAKFPFLWVGFALAWLFLLPSNSIIPLAEQVAERRAYLPMFGAALAVADLFARSPLRERSIVWVGAAASIVFGIASFDRASYWGDPLKLWTDAATKSPSRSRPKYWRGMYLMRIGRCQEAASSIEESTRLSTETDPHQIGIVVGQLAFARSCVGDAQGTVQAVDRALSLDPVASDMYALKARTLIGLGRNGEAMELANRSVACPAPSSYAYVTRAVLNLNEKKDVEAARRDLDEALRIDPRNGEAFKLRQQLR